MATAGDSDAFDGKQSSSEISLCDAAAAASGIRQIAVSAASYPQFHMQPLCESAAKLAAYSNVDGSASYIVYQAQSTPQCIALHGHFAAAMLTPYQLTKMPTMVPCVMPNRAFTLEVTMLLNPYMVLPVLPFSHPRYITALYHERHEAIAARHILTGALPEYVQVRFAPSIRVRVRDYVPASCVEIPSWHCDIPGNVQLLQANSRTHMERCVDNRIEIGDISGAAECKLKIQQTLEGAMNPVPVVILLANPAAISITKWWHIPPDTTAALATYPIHELLNLIAPYLQENKIAYTVVWVDDDLAAPTTMATLTKRQFKSRVHHGFQLYNIAAIALQHGAAVINVPQSLSTAILPDLRHLLLYTEKLCDYCNSSTCPLIGDGVTIAMSAVATNFVNREYKLQPDTIVSRVALCYTYASIHVVMHDLILPFWP